MLDVWRLRSVNQTWQWAQPYQWWTIQLEHSARIENVSVSWADISRRYPIRMINLGWSRWLSLVLRLASWLAVDLASVPHSSQCKWACRQPCVPAMICHRHRMTHHRNFGRARLILNRRFGLRCRRDLTFVPPWMVGMGTMQCGSVIWPNENLGHHFWGRTNY